MSFYVGLTGGILKERIIQYIFRVKNRTSFLFLIIEKLEMICNEMSSLLKQEDHLLQRVF